MQPNEKMNKCDNKIMFNFTPPQLRRAGWIGNISNSQRYRRCLT